VIAAAAALTFAELWHDVDVSMLEMAPRLSALVYPTLYVSAAVLALQALLGGAVTSVRGIVSIDQPLHGRRPDDPEVEVLMAVADQAGLAVERAQREAEGENGAPDQSPELRLAAELAAGEPVAPAAPAA